MRLAGRLLSSVVSFVLLAGLLSPSVALAAAPSAPSGLAATAAGPTQVNLSWKDNSTTETGFHVERAINDNFNAGQVTFAVAADATTLNDISASPNQIYFYRVTAINADGNSAPSNAVSLTTPPSGSGTPAAPSGLTAVVSNGKVILNWVDASNNEIAFRVERCDNSGFPPKSILPFVVGGNGTALVDPNPPANTTSFFRVFAVNAAGQSTPSNTVQVTTSAIIAAGPAAPSALQAATVGNTQVNLTWADNSADETGFRIERAVKADFVDGLVRTIVAANTKTFSDIAVSSGQALFYRVFAFNASGDSTPSNTVTLTTPASAAGAPAAPTNLKATVSGGKVSLSWTNNANNASNVRVERCDNAGFPPKSILPFVVGGNATTAVDANPPPSTTSFFRVIAVNDAGQSAPSNAVEVNVPATTGTPVALTGLTASQPLAVDPVGAAVGASNLTDPDGDLTLGIPGGTKLTTATGQPVTSLTAEDVAIPAQAPGVSILNIHQLGPEGAQFDPPLAVTFTYDTANLPAGANETGLTIAFWTGSQWASLASTVDTTAKTVSASLSHFSQVALLAQVPPAPIPPTPAIILPIVTVPPPAPIQPPPAITEPPPTTPPPPAAAPVPPAQPTNPPPPPTTTSTGFNSTWIIAGIVVIVAAVVLALVMLKSRKRGAQ